MLAELGKLRSARDGVRRRGRGGEGGSEDLPPAIPPKLHRIMKSVPIWIWIIEKVCTQDIPFLLLLFFWKKSMIPLPLSRSLPLRSAPQEVIHFRVGPPGDMSPSAFNKKCRHRKNPGFISPQKKN